MATVIFVHGTGVRQPQYVETFKQIKQKLHVQHPDLHIIPCLWGDSVGVKLNANGVSIPKYDTTLVPRQEEGEDYERDVKNCACNLSNPTNSWRLVLGKNKLAIA